MKTFPLSTLNIDQNSCNPSSRNEFGHVIEKEIKFQRLILYMNTFLAVREKLCPDKDWH